MLQILTNPFADFFLLLIVCAIIAGLISLLESTSKVLITPILERTKQLEIQLEIEKECNKRVLKEPSHYNSMLCEDGYQGE